MANRGIYIGKERVKKAPHQSCLVSCGTTVDRLCRFLGGFLCSPALFVGTQAFLLCSWLPCLAHIPPPWGAPYFQTYFSHHTLGHSTKIMPLNRSQMSIYMAQQWHDALGDRARSRCLPVLSVRAALRWSPDLQFTFQIIPQHMLGQTNKTSPTSLCSHSKNANPTIDLDHQISFLGVWKYLRSSENNLTRNCMEKYFVILYISLACKFQKVWLTPEFSHWSYFYAIHIHLLILPAENTAPYYICSDLHLEPFIELITFDWG